MIVDFSKIDEQRIVGFKGGRGELLMRAADDGRCRIMLSILRAGASSGEHIHSENCEVIMVLEGELTFFENGVEEKCRAGQVHYCRKGNAHWFENRTDKDAKYFAVVCGS